MKNRRLEIRLTEDELYAIDIKAKQLRMTRSKYVIQSALHQRIILLDNTAIKQLTAELRKVGVNINQIATLCNMGKLECVNIEDTQQEIRRIWKELKRLRDDVKKLNEES